MYRNFLSAACLSMACKNKKHPAFLKQDGNIFFALFGAIALVGVLGTITISVMRGPLSTMVEVQTRTQAESEMAIASRLALLEATELSANGDCDGDGFVEPLEYQDAAGAGPTGGGFLPNAVASSRIDPWGTEYGYCAWDAGGVTNNIACDTDTSGTNERLDGNASPTDETYSVIAIISAGPDQTFNSSCTGGATPSITKAGDDIITEFTYAGATAETGGLWNLKSGDPTTAEITKNLEVDGSASFSGGIDLTGSSSALELGAASLLFPTDGTLINCNAANHGLIRINTSLTPDGLELCDSSVGWVQLGGGLWEEGTGDDIYYDDGTPQVGIGKNNPSEALDVTGNIAASGNITAGSDITATGNVSGTDVSASGNATITGTLGVTGTSNLGTLNASGAVDFDSSLNVDGATTLAGTLDAQGNISDSTGDLTISDNLVVTGTSDLQGDITNSTGNVTIDKDAEILGSLDVVDASISNDLTVDGTVSNPSGNLAITDDVDVTGAIDATGDIDGSDITASGDVNAGNTINVNGDQLGPAVNCSSTQKLEWNNGTGWSCVTDLQGGAGGGTPALDDLTDVAAATPTDGECLVYNNTSGDWENAPCSGTGAGIFEIVSNVARVKSTAGDYTNDDFVFGSPQLADDGDANHDSRFFFDKSKGAFRAGRVDGTHWDDANVGIDSIALGRNSQATASDAMALGWNNTVSASRGTVLGSQSTVSASDAYAIGRFVGSSGLRGGAMGYRVDNDGDYSLAIGLGNPTGAYPIVTGTSSLGIFMGDQGGVDITAANTMSVMGGTVAIGDTSASTGGEQNLELDVTGDIGATNYCDADGNNCTAATDLGGGLWTDLTGGRIHYGTNSTNQVGVGTANPQTTLDVNGGVRVGSVSGGAAPTFMNLNDLGDVSASSPTSGDCIVYNNSTGNWESGSCVSGSNLGIFEVASNVVRMKSTAGDYTNDDFVFGSPQLDDDGDANHDARMFFDKSKGAFRAGQVDGAQWDNANIGDESVAFGLNNTASGTRSFVAGFNSIASGTYSIALGNNLNSTGQNSMAWGNYVNATGQYSTAGGATTVASGIGSFAIGEDAIASGDQSFAFGLGDATGTGVNRPTVSGDSSFGIFMGDQTGLDLTDANTMSLMGGELGIGTLSPSEILQVEGSALFRDCTYINRRDATDQCGGSHYTFATKGQWSNQILHTSGAAASSTEVILAEGTQATHRATFGFDASTDIAYVEADAADLVLLPANNVGIGSNFHSGGDTIESMLHIQSGDIRLDGGEGNQAGCIRYNDTSDELEFSDDCSTFTAINSAGSALWTDNTTHITREDMHIINAASNSTAASLDGVGTYSFYASNKSALRGGEMNAVDNTAAWQDTNIGNNSFAWGRNVNASGSNSATFGQYSGTSGDNSFAFGSYVNSSGYGSFTGGHLAQSFSTYGFTYGDRIWNFGERTAAFGLGVLSVNDYPDVGSNGDESFVVFLGDQNSVVMDTAHTFGIFGGSVVIDPAQPATQMAPRASLDIGAATDALITPSGTTAQRPGTPVNGMIRYNSTTNEFEGYENGTWVSMGSGSSVLEVASNVVRGVSGTVTYATDDFVFGSPQLDDDTNASHDSRMWFDKSKGAFRAGSEGTVVPGRWDTANAGNYSAAFGEGTAASAPYSFAAGFYANASGDYGVAFGNQTQAGRSSLAVGSETEATGWYSFAAGRFADATANYSTAIGQEVIVSGTNSVGFGLGTSAGTNPTVSGSSSFGIFMGDQSGVDIATDNIMSVMGGNVGIGTVAPASPLHVSGNSGNGTYAMTVDNVGSDGEIARFRNRLGQNSVAIDQSSSSNPSITMRTATLGGGNAYLEIMTNSGARYMRLSGSSLQFAQGDFSSYDTNLYRNGDDILRTNDSFIIDQNLSVGTTDTHTQLDIDGTLKIAYDSEACDADREGAIHYDATTDEFKVCATAGSWSTLALSGSSSLWTDNTTHITREDVHILNSGTTMTAAGFDSVSVDGVIVHTDKRALRTGNSDNTAWNEANIGSRSFGAGKNPWATASDSVAMGWESRATAGVAIAMGSQAYATGENSLSFGRKSTASGRRALAIGLGDATGTAPVVSGDDSLGIFMGDQSGIDVTGNNIMSIMGGDVGIGTVSPDETLTINASDADFSQYSYGNTPQHIFYRANGTEASPSGVSDGDYIGLIDFYGHQSGTGYNNAAYMGAVADGNADVGQVPMALVFGVAYNFGAGKLAQEKLRIDKNGRFGFKDRTADAQYEFSLDGSTALPFFMISTDDDNDGDVLYIGSNSDASFGGTGGLKIHSGTTAQRPGSPDNGTIRYNSTTNKFEGYENGAWTDLAGDSSLWTDNTTHITRGNYHILNTGETMITAGFDGTTPTGMIYYTDQQALRMGVGSFSRWDEANIGNRSFAVGSAEASGSHSVGMGQSINATGNFSFAAGDGSQAGGTYAVAMGGGGTTADGVGSFATGYSNTASGSRAIAMGNETTASGDYAVALGLGDATGTAPVVSGNSSLGIFMGDQSGEDLNVANMMVLEGGSLMIGDGALDNSTFVNADITIAETASSASLRWGPAHVNSGTMAGYLGYDGSSTTTRINVDNGSLHIYASDAAASDAEIYLDGDTSFIGLGNGTTTPAAELDIGGTGAIILTRGTTAERPGTGVNGMIRYNATTNKFEGYENGAWTDLAGSSSLWTDNTTHITRGATHIVNAGDTMTTSGFDTGVSGFIVHTDKLAIRSGSASGNQWQETSIGSASAAFGLRPIASGSYSMAFGNDVTASGASAIAAGSNVTASASHAVALGYRTNAGATDSTAIGREASVSGVRSMAIGLGAPAGADPIVSGNESFGIFMGDQSGVDLTQANTMAIMGGKLGIGTTSPTGELDVITQNNSADTIFRIGSGVDSGSTASSILQMRERNGGDYARGFDLLYNGAAGDHFAIQTLNSGGTTEIMRILRSNGYMGIGGDFTTDTIESQLHIAAGDIRLDGGVGNEAGCIRFDDTTDQLQYSDDCTTFSAFSAGGASVLNDLTDVYTDYTTEDNLIIGRTGAAALTAGARNNVFIGELSGATSGNSTATTDYNTSVGYLNLFALTSGNHNASFGYGALNGVTSGTGNTAIGSGAGTNVTTTSGTTAIGYNALREAGNNPGNTALGYSAGGGNGATTSITTSTLLGYNAGKAGTGDNLTISASTLVGYDAGGGGNTGDKTLTNSVIIGASAGTPNTSETLTTTDMVVIGNNTLDGNTTVAQGVVIGFEAGDVLDGDNNTLIGYRAGNSITTGSDNILIGHDVDTPAATTSNYLNIGDLIHGDMTNNLIGIGTSVPQARLDLDEGSVGQRLLIWSGNGNLDRHGLGVDMTGNSYETNLFGVRDGAAGYRGHISLGFVDDTDGTTYTEEFRLTETGNIGIGDFSVDTIESSIHVASGDIRIDGGAGNEAGCLRFNDTTDQIEFSDDCSNFLPINAAGAQEIDSLGDAKTDYTTDHNMFLGFQNGANVASGAVGNIGLGENALDALTTGDNNIAIGYQSLGTVTTAFGNVAIGRRAMNELLNNGGANVAIGLNALRVLDNGYDNTIIGDEAFEALDGDRSGNTGLGNNVGKAMTAGSFNTFIGSDAGETITTGSRNIFIGDKAADGQTSGDDNILIGQNIELPNLTGSDQLNIGNLIYGDLASNLLGIGDFSADTIESSIHVASGDIRIDGGAGNEAGCIRFNDTADQLEYSNDCSTYSTFGGGSGVFEVSSNVVRGISGTVTYATDDFVFGSSQLADTGDANHDNRMFFDKSKGAFRAGRAQSTQWDDASIGDYSAAFGTNTVASGENAFAVGGGASAANDNAIAFGSGASASAAHAFTIGDMQVSNHSFGVALGFSAGTQPNVSGANSIGLFMGDQSGQVLSSANTMALMGGDIVIGSTQLADTGTGNEDSRMFFDVSKGAIRAGTVGGTEWDDGNVGTNSAAFGYQAEASGASSFAAGSSVSAGASASIALGNNAYTQHYAAVSIGVNNTVSGARSVSIGDSTNVSGTNSMAIGLGQDAGTRPVISGDNSFGILIGDQSGVDLADNNTVAIMGATGGVGIGTVSPNSDGLHIDTGGVLIRGTDGANASRFLVDTSSGNTEMTLYSGAQVDTVKIDSVGTSHFTGGNVGIGTDTPSYTLSVTGDDSDIGLMSNSASDKADMRIIRSRGTETTPTAVAADDALGGLQFMGYDGTAYERGAQISAYVDTGATVADEDMPTHLRFETRNATDTSGVERMRLDSDGNLGIGNLSPAYTLDVDGDINIASGQTYRLGGEEYIHRFLHPGNNITQAFGTQQDHSSLDTTSYGANLFVGFEAGERTTTGITNTFVGNGAGRFNTTGGGNTTLGYNAGIQNRTGGSNVMIGQDAGTGSFAASDVSRNVMVGREAGAAILTGADDNVFIGYQTGDATTTGSDNILIGSGVEATSATASNELNIGNSIYGDLSNDYIGIGNTSPNVALDVTGDIEYTGTITDVSDQRLKENIKSLNTSGDVIDRITQINTYSFTMKNTEDARTEFGVMAQELEKIFPELVHTADDEMGTKSVNYVGLIAPMIEATKELKTENDTLKQELAELKTAQVQTNETLTELSKQVALLNKVTGQNIGKKASMESYIMLLLGLIGGGMFMMLIHRRKAHNG